MIIMKAKAHNYCFSIMVMFNEDTNDDYYGADDGWCRGDNDVKVIVPVVVFIVVVTAKDDDLYRVPYVNRYLYIIRVLH